MKKTVRVLIIALTVAGLALLCACSGAALAISFGAKSETSAVDTGFIFSLRCEDDQGNVYSADPEGYYEPGTEITIHATWGDDAAFYCWTLGDTLENKGTVLSYDKDYTFTLEEDTYIYGNFRSNDTALVLYHANGGTVVETGNDTLWDEFSLAYYLYPNTLADMGYFEYEGYNLIGYNTEPDGSGEFYNVGGKAFEDTDEVIELYCVWSEQTPSRYFSFDYSYDYEGWMVSGYVGDFDEVSIPTTFNGEPVVGVAEGALTGAEMTTLVLPSCLQVIEDYSFNECANLTTVYVYDSLTYISDDTFDNDESLTTVYFSAATNPKFSNWFNNHSKKVELMAYWTQETDDPIMICLGGSSTAYALDAQLLQELIDEDYIVLNCGSNGANLFNMTSEWAMHFLREGDMLLQITEYSFWQLGGVQCRWESFRSFESCYNVFSWVDAGQYTEFFNSFCTYLTSRASMTDMTYEDYQSTLAPNGYYDIQGTLKIIAKANGSADFHTGRSIYFSGDWLYSYMIYYLNRQYSRLDDMGVTYAMAFTPLNENSLYSYQTDEAMEEFEDYLDEVLNITIVSDLQENIFEPEIFFDDDYHLSADGREIYTTQLAEDLNEYFASLSEEAAD
ncbi:MAG: leucine-rich repeat domain-containing protein [Oscillospiraceae bacterium]|nr:leucine-rich repeat domain-containing protein [Oscillospiraceae bacterium]